MDKKLEYYLGLPYTRELIPDPTGVWFVRIKELPGCVSQGNTQEEALRMIEDAMRGWIKVSLEDGDPIPEPRPEEEFSGKFVIRVPKSLHRKLVETAESEEVSLNQYVNVALGLSVGENTSTVSLAKEGAEISSWPGLSAGAAHALQMAGLSSESGEIEERLFAEWSGKRMHNIAMAYRDGFSRELFEGLDELIVIMRQNSKYSPVLNLFVQVLSLLRQVCNDALKKTGTIFDSQILAQLSQVMLQVNQATLQNTPLTNAGYSQASASFEAIAQTGIISTKQSLYGKTKEEW
jgi:antitoxin HicB